MHLLLKFLSFSIIILLIFFSCSGIKVDDADSQRFPTEIYTEISKKPIDTKSVTSTLWRIIPTKKADVLKWKRYASNVMTDQDMFIKITTVNDNRGANLFLDTITDEISSTADSKNYKITFTARIVGGDANSNVAVRNFSDWNDELDLLNTTETTYTVYIPNTLDGQRPRITFTGLPVGSKVYISKNISISRMVDRVYQQPDFTPKGIILDIKEPTDQATIDEWFADLDSIGVKFIRLQVSPSFAMEGLTKDEYITSVIDRIKTRYVPKLQQYGMQAMFCWEGVPFDDPALNNRKNPGYWENPVIKETFLQMAHATGSGLKDVQEIKAFQFCGEPVNQDNQVPDNWREISNEVNAIVRQYTDKFIAWTAGPGGLSRFKKVVPLDDSRIIYNFHNYTPQEYTHQGIDSYPFGVVFTDTAMVTAFSGFADFKTRNNGLPLMIGAYSVATWVSDGSAWFDRHVELCTQYGIPSIQHLVGQYRLWDWRYTCVRNTTPSDSTYTYDKSSSNVLWTKLASYLKGL